MKNPIHWEASDCLFVFGSLMDLEVLELVSGLAELTINAATVEGFRQCEVSEESYPVLVADEASVCHGLLVGGLTVLAVQRILFFEGDEYTLEPISVTGDETATEINRAYYFKDTGAYTVKAESWDYEQWQLHHKPSFIKASADYMMLFGHMSAAEADAKWLEITSRTEALDGGSIERSESVESLQKLAS